MAVEVAALVARTDDYADGTPRVTLDITHTQAEGDWPNPPEKQERDVELVFGSAVYTAHLRVVDSYVYVCTPVFDANGQERRLAEVLKEHNLADVDSRPFKTGQQVRLRLAYQVNVLGKV